MFVALSICLAPKVWQCLAGIPSSEGVYHIYEIETDYPIKAHGTRDAHLISEYWLTDEQLESEIPLKYRGFIELTQKLNTTIARLSNIKNPKYGILDDPAFWEMPDGGEWKFDEYPQ
ncbi:hypothetical protein F1728_15355 [Gimesia benthica]|uniref:Uncharacterized protein n=1 Tax=Gimesia benthica TaxID=2608982 RepID=A0A6I6ABU0_9PLAN|nr:hypothetical protein [Gimesia benthica]QGQ23974.1 hypothetical protein F1728_15355 [Gimesia benthica]